MIDSHTAGEPTRTVVSGGPELAGGDWAAKRQFFAEHCDVFRKSILLEPRGNDVLVGAIIGPPVNPDHAAGVVFFNNVGVLQMCGHGLIGVIVTLAHLGQISAGSHVIETPVGDVQASISDDLHTVTIRNVPSYRLAKNVVLQDSAGNVASLPDGTAVRGDVAWGGNWFFLMHRNAAALRKENLTRLIEDAALVRELLRSKGITGADDAEIDHIEFQGPSESGTADSRGFVLCPGGQWDRSPCGTGTSAKLACMAADGQLPPGVTWRHESILESWFDARYELGNDETIHPSITGTAYVTATSELQFHPDDPFAKGIVLP